MSDTQNVLGPQREVGVEHGKLSTGCGFVRLKDLVRASKVLIKVSYESV